MRHAAALLGLGVTAGDRVALLLPASADLVALLLAVTRVGAIAVPVNARYRPDEVATSSCTPAPRSWSPRRTARAWRPRPRRPRPQRGRARGPTPELRALVTLADLAGAGRAPTSRGGGRHPRPRPRRARLHLRHHGRAEGRAALARGAGPARGRDRRADGADPDDRIWTAIPLFHGGGITFAVAALAARRRVRPPRALRPRVHARPARVRTGHGRARRLRDDLAAGARPPRLGRPRPVPASGSSWPSASPSGCGQMAARLPQAEHVSCVAMTESSAFLALGRLDDPPEACATTGGQPMPGMRCRVVDPDTGADLPPGTPASCSSAARTRSTATSATPSRRPPRSTRTGWFHSGDVVVADADGRSDVPTPAQGHAQGRRRERGRRRGRGPPAHPPGGRDRRRRRRPGRALRGGAGRVRAARAPGDRHRGGADRALPGRIATYRVPRYVRFVERVAHVRHEDPEGGLRERIAEELAAAGITEAPRPASRV